MIKVLRIGHATFETPDLDKAIDNYTQVVGLAMFARDHDRAFMASKSGQLTIELRRGERPRCSKLSFEVPPEPGFGELARTLAAHGIKAEQRGDAAPGLPKLLAFEDPKGTTIELFSEWSALEPREQVVGVGALKLGHVAFTIDDPKKVADFYAEVLGFRMSDWIGDFFVFMRCNADHHTVNFITGKNLGMHHIAFEVRDFAHLQTGCDLLGDKRIPIIWGPVRLGPGHNVATFHRDHDDWVIEFYAELDQMKSEELGYYEPRPWHRDRPQRPKVWPRETAAFVWGLPPAPDFFRNR